MSTTTDNAIPTLGEVKELISQTSSNTASSAILAKTSCNLYNLCEDNSLLYNRNEWDIINFNVFDNTPGIKSITIAIAIRPKYLATYYYFSLSSIIYITSTSTVPCITFPYTQYNITLNGQVYKIFAQCEMTVNSSIDTPIAFDIDLTNIGSQDGNVDVIVYSNNV